MEYERDPRICFAHDPELADIVLRSLGSNPEDRDSLHPLVTRKGSRAKISYLKSSSSDVIDEYFPPMSTSKYIKDGPYTVYIESESIELPNRDRAINELNKRLLDFVKSKWPDVELVL